MRTNALKLVCSIFIFPVIVMAQSDDIIKVGAKHFNEGYILSEMISILLEDAGYKVERKFNLGGTAVSFAALENNAIDIYPEYTGTIAAEILKDSGNLNMEEINARLISRFDLEISRPYGFNNTYALVMSSGNAKDLQISKISELRNHPEFIIGLSYEFLKREDGWEPLSSSYDLSHMPVGLEHGLAYEALFENDIDVTDAYSTDGEIRKYDLTLLEDDNHFFPDYFAVSLFRKSLPDKARQAIKKLTSLISEEEMQALNFRSLFEKRSYAEVARSFLEEKKLIKKTTSRSQNAFREILSKTLVHLKLTLLALFAAVVAALPLGIFIYKNPSFSKGILYLTGILQTIPSIALLALMIPLFGIGILPALVALFLYALLPVLRNTVIGLFTVDPELKRVASAIGIDDRRRLLLIELPLALPTILTGIRTAAVINVGTATLSAFIGAGGLGEFIVTGLALNNTELILKGALPAALLAILIEVIFESVELAFIPKHLRPRMHL